MLDELEEFNEANVNSPLHVYIVKYFLYRVKKEIPMYSLHRRYGSAYWIAARIVDRLFGDLILNKEEKQYVIVNYIDFVLNNIRSYVTEVDPKKFVFSYKHVDLFKDYLKTQARVDRLKEVSKGVVIDNY